MKILYLGNDHPLLTSAHRANALRRLGHEVTHLDPEKVLPTWRYLASFNVRTGFRLYAGKVRRSLWREIGDRTFDVVWVDSGAALDPRAYREFHDRGWKIINYNIDDPFGGRDYRKWDLYLQSVRYHDLTVVVRTENIAEAKSHGATRVLRVFRSFDPVAHAPVTMDAAERARWASDVVFVGSWMPERGPFMARLLELGVPLSIWGDHWHKAPEYERLRGAIRGAAVYGADYVKPIQCAKVALGLLSKGNRDLHTTRSAEVPFVGGAVFCAERTTEHAEMFTHGKDALLWRDADECAREALAIATDESRRLGMVSAARQRIEALGLSNDLVQAEVLRVLATTDLNRRDS